MPVFSAQPAGRGSWQVIVASDTRTLASFAVNTGGLFVHSNCALITIGWQGAAELVAWWRFARIHHI
jgi:hypothetical protein